MKKTILLTGIICFMVLLNIRCKKDDDVENDNTINIFSVQDDKDFGYQLSQEILANPQEYPLLDTATYQEAYTHLYRFRDQLLNTGKVAYADEFAWQVRIIKNDTVVNAFAGPGGYLYFYTGIIKALDDESQFSGVMAHEMAHSARRHCTDQLTKAYGLQILLSIILGENPSKMAEIAAALAQGLSSLAFSRDDEYEADEFAVKYNYDTDIDSRGIGDFFEKIEGLTSPPSFLSTHPSPEDRLAKITEIWQGLGGQTGSLYQSRYQDFKNSLP